MQELDDIGESTWEYFQVSGVLSFIVVGPTFAYYSAAPPAIG